MFEKISHAKNEVPEPKWVLPDFNSPQEIGELERVASTFSPDDPERIIQTFLERAHNPQIRVLDEDLLQQLENTDANDIQKGDFDLVASKLAEMSAHDPLQKRDWESLKNKMEQGMEMDMPVIVKLGDRFHLMSGNTRLMVSRALGQMPAVAIVDIA